MTFQSTTRSTVSTLLGLLFAVPALAQYGGGGGGMGGAGSPGGKGVYTPPKGGYSSGTGIAIGAGVAAGATLGYLALRSHHTIVGCLQPSTDGVNLFNEKDQNTYALVAANIALQRFHRVADA